MKADSSSPPPADEALLRRLAFAKYIFWLGVEQSHRPEPLSSVAVLHFHDAAEFFIDAAMEARDATAPSGASFLECWERLAQKVPDGLAHKEAMRRLNQARVNLKHHGIVVTALDVRDLREATRRFFTDNTPRCFDLDFDRVSLADLVLHRGVRADLKQAEIARAEGRLKDAFAHAAIAMQRLIDDYTRGARGWSLKSPFDFGENMGFMSSHMLGLGSLHSKDRDITFLKSKLANFVDSTKKSIESMQEGMKLLSLGLDYRRYARFDWLTPDVYMTMGSVDYQFADYEDPARTDADADFCIEFVVETALRFQDVDVTRPADPPGRRNRAVLIPPTVSAE